MGTVEVQSDGMQGGEENGERGKRGFSCYEQKVKGSSSSPQSHAKGLEGRMTERGDKND